MKTIKILLPKTWSFSAEVSYSETEEDAEILVKTANPAYGHNPYTVQVKILQHIFRALKEKVFIRNLFKEWRMRRSG